MIAVKLIICAVMSYLLGSVNFSIIISRLYAKSDIRKYGSGNAGATNVLRSIGKVPAAITMAGDMAKVIVAIYVARLIIGEQRYEYFPVLFKYAAGFFCLIGHMYPLYFGFKGGKGVATAAGMILVVDWRIFLILLGIFIIMVAIFRMVSLGSVVVAAVFPFLTYLMYTKIPKPTGVTSAYLDFIYPNQRLIVTLIAIGFAVIVIFKHRKNIKRIIDGTEAKMSKKNKNQN